MNESRDQLLAIVERDLIGPRDGLAEAISDRPSDRYLTGALYPIPLEDDSEQGDKPADEDDKDSADAEDTGPGDAIDLGSIHRPASMGISFMVEGPDAVLVVIGSAGRYAKPSGTDPWNRSHIVLDGRLKIGDVLRQEPAADGLEWTIRPVPVEGGRLVSLVLTNTVKAGKGRDEHEQSTFFQVGFSIEIEGGRILPRAPGRSGTDPDSLANALIYRRAKEFASGHACSATWASGQDESITVSTTWCPAELVPGITADGHQIFSEVSTEVTGDRFTAYNAEGLGTCPPNDLTRRLSVVPEAYERWLASERSRAEALQRSGDLTAEQLNQARVHLDVAAGMAARMRSGIAALASDTEAREAFQWSQRVMLQQARWRKKDPALVFHWRPFQIGFQLLALPGLIKPATASGDPTDDRRIMDLLWFPTGGGKTEAYLGLIAFVLILRRLRQHADPEAGAGVGAFMRYTLRLLTTQQFERAARMIMACETLREECTKNGDRRLGKTRFSLGLWVGDDVTPNKRENAETPEGRKKARQLAACPVCGATNSIGGEVRKNLDRFVMWCEDKSCPTGREPFPIWTVDEDIYLEKPGLLIATVDKFAQIVRRSEIGNLFRVDDNPPDLIIQDELHLISGPLGSMVGLYEVAIERLCTKNRIPPKIIGSTATIRRAETQVRSLFARPVSQFPPPVLDDSDSCFALADTSRPGRLYVGLSSAGRSPKYLLQAVSAVVMQGVTELPDTVEARDPYWTLLLYFNSLRELGGALVMLYDDVQDSMKLLSKLSGIAQRVFDEEPMEMTSRTGSADLPIQLKKLEKKYPDQEFGPVLATNMISVGVDVDRLGLMIVNGQPKSMAEYIQATSRVGREQTPGLVITCYNAGRPRDRSHFETFRTWHQALYRGVEASSVTPFAPRARDRALHAPLVAMIRHTIPAMNSSPALGQQFEKEVTAIIELLSDRSQAVEPQERHAVRNELAAFVERWRNWGDLDQYWNDKIKHSLLVSAEYAAEIRARSGRFSSASQPTPGSMRNVEPSAVLVMKESLGGRGTDDGAQTE